MRVDLECVFFARSLQDCIRAAVFGLRRTNRLPLMKIRAFAVGLLLALACPPVRAADELIEFIENPNGLSPARTLEFRFSEEMVKPDDVTKGGLPTPINVVPPIAGKWTWQSTRSGVFTPAEPWPLGTTIKIRPSEGATTLTGKELPADWSRTLEMPSFAPQAWTNLSYRNEHDQSAEPRLCVMFNADVNPAEIASSFTFIRNRNEKVAAKVESPDGRNPGLSWFRHWQTNERSLQTWKERFEQPGQSTGTRKNQVFVSPIKPLPPGDGWKLVLASGIPAAHSNLRTLVSVDVAIGDVKPFELGKIEATNYLNSGRVLQIQFNKSLREKLDTSALSRWISITPLPAKLEATVSGSRVEYRGEFSLGQEYRVAVEPGVPAQESFVLSSGRIEQVTFEAIPPRLYFEAYETHQMSGGTRKFNLLAVNTPKIRVSAKLFTGTTIPEALRGYDKYYNAPDGAEDEAHTKVNVDALAGQVIWQQELEGTGDVDEQKEVALDWSEILGNGRSGVVLLTAEAIPDAGNTDKIPGSQAIVQLTDLGAVWKRAPGETFVQVFSMKTGQGVGGAQVRLLSEADKLVAEAKADEHGIARLPAANDARWILVEKGTDTHLVEFRNGRNYINLARVDVEFSEEDEHSGSESVRTFLFTERGVYKPGDTVHLKGILRDRRAGRPELGTGLAAKLIVIDAKEREFFNKKLALSANGSFAEDIKLPMGSLGQYRAVVRLVAAEGEEDSSIADHEFQVEEYKPNAFEIAIGDGPRAPGPAELQLPISAKYYMGKALSKAQLTWSINANDESFEPGAFKDFAFADAIDNYRLEQKLGRFAHVSLQGKVDLDAEGAATIGASIPLNAKAPQPRSVSVLCEVTDINQQTVSTSKSFRLNSSDFYLGFRTFRSLLHEGEAIPLDVIAVRTDETPTPEPVAVEAQLTRIEWQNNRVETEDGATEYRNEPKFELVARRTLTTATVTKAGDRWQIGATKLSEALVPEKPGEYLLELSARDAAGRQVVTATSFQVYGKGETAWDYRNPFQVEMVPEYDEYKAGDTAKILIKTPISGDALVTIEREHVLRSFVTRLEGNAPVVQVPMLPDDAPNIFVSVMLLRGADQSPRKFKAPEYRIGYCELKVSNPASKLSVYVRPEKKAYEPAQEVRVTAEVLDYLGKPVPNAEITLYAVDEGVLSLTGYALPDPLSYFNQPRSLSVTTALTLPALLNEDPEGRDFGNKGYLIGGGGDDAMNVRKNFLACAFWNATLATDAAGKALASFTAPDSLTRYRVMAVVQTKKTQFGSGQSAFEVNKPMMIEPALPRFANVSDKMTLRAVVHNTTDLEGEAEVQVKFDLSVKAGEPKRKIHLKPHETTALDFPVEFVETGTAVWEWSVRFVAGEAVHRDAVQSKLKVGYPAPMLRHVKTMRVDKDIPNLLAGVDPQLLEGKGMVKVSLTNSRAIELQEALDQLLHYPYGCVEQTTSSTLPWLTLTRMRDLLPSLQRSEDDINDNIQRGINRLLSMQTASGGLSYWPGGTDPMLWGSAYGSLALTLAKQQGRPVPEEEYENLMKWMGEQLRGTSGVKTKYDLVPRVLAAYALAFAGRSEPAYHELLFQRKNDLSAEDRGLLAVAILDSKGSQQMVDDLMQSADQAPTESEWFWYRSRSTAIQLLSWMHYQPKSNRVEGIANDLFAQRRQGHWWTTQGNAWSLLAMGEYLTKIEGENHTANGKLQWGGETKQFALGNKPQTKAQVFPVSIDRSALPLGLASTKSGPLYTEIQVESYPPLREQPSQDHGYQLTRTYTKVEDDGKLTEAKDLKVGDRILVTLNLEIREHAGYLAIEDPLPAIFEAVNPTFKTQETRVGEQLGSDWLCDFRELREDRALFFADRVSPGRYTLRYLARVAAAGQATAPCAKVEEMYRPERCGLSAAIKISAAPLN